MNIEITDYDEFMRSERRLIRRRSINIINCEVRLRQFKSEGRNFKRFEFM